MTEKTVHGNTQQIKEPESIICFFSDIIDDLAIKARSNVLSADNCDRSDENEQIIDYGTKGPLKTSKRTNNKRTFPKQQLVIACLASYTCMFMGGVCQSWMEPLTIWYQSQNSTIPMSEDQVSLVVSLVEVGAFFAPLPFGMLIDRVGRKMSILLTGTLALAGFLLAVLTRSVWTLCLSRVLSGLALGGVTTVAPIYIAEIAPPSIRGALAGQLITMYFVGQLVTYVCGHYLAYYTYLWVCSAIPLVLIYLAGSCSESPTYFLKTGKPDLALKAIRKLRKNFQWDEFEASRAAIEKEQDSGTDWRMLLRPGPLKMLLLLQLLCFVGELNGLPALTLYATQTFGGREWLTLAMGGILAGSSFFAAFLTDSVGRRPMLAISLAGSAISTSILATYFYIGDTKYLITGTIFFCIISSVGINPLIATLQGELFPASTRGIATGISELTASLGSFISLITYIPVSNAYGIGANYIAYSAFSIIGFLAVILFLPETANINIDVHIYYSA